MFLLISWRPALAASPSEVEPGEEILEAQIGDIIEESETETAGQRQIYQQMEAIIVSGPRKGEIVIVENGAMLEVNARRYRPGDRVFIRLIEKGDSCSYVVDIPSRWPALLGVLAVFALTVVIITRWRSVTSLGGLAFSFLVVFVYILPRLAAGAEPLHTILIGSVVIVPVSFYLAHGASLKTTIAMVGTVIALILTIVLAQSFVRLAGLTGYASEEALFLQAQAPGAINIQSLLVAGIIVSVLGVLDDVTVSQAAIVQQLHQANPQLSFSDLYRRAMQVGQDHIASMVNTLALVYAGAALPLLLLLRTSPLPLTYLLSQEIIAEEIVRMMVSSIGLMTAVPITTLLAAFVVARILKLLSHEEEEDTDA